MSTKTKTNLSQPAGSQKKIEKFVRNTWAKIAAFIVLRRLKNTPDSPLDFARFFQKPENWLLVMPAEAKAFDAAMVYCLELLQNVPGIHLHLLVPQDFLHWVHVSPYLKVHPYDSQDLRLGRFPRDSLLQRLKRLNPAVAMDLSPHPTPLSLSICGLIGARVRGAFSREYGDAIFNFLVKTRAGDIGEQYRALFAYLS
ncbi:MAG: hypothetical protein NTW14_03300 [bacterium]|nr:hypothetical protein [bacterium]